jgi:uncharacterized membrane protein
LRDGDIPEPESVRPGNHDGRPPGEPVRQHDAKPACAAAPDADQTPAAEPSPANPEPSGAGNNRTGPVTLNARINPLVIREAVREEIQAHWPAPLPPPETLAGYNQIVPGTAERIVSMTERSVTCAIDTGYKLANAGIDTARAALRAALVLNLLAFTVSVVFFALENQAAGLAFASFPTVMLIRSFLVHPRHLPQPHLPEPTRHDTTDTPIRSTPAKRQESGPGAKLVTPHTGRPPPRHSRAGAVRP